MKPGLTRYPWVPLLLCTALGSLACDSLKSAPNPVSNPGGTPGGIPAGGPHVALDTQGPAFCREGTWTLSVSVQGGSSEKVELLTWEGEEPFGEARVTALEPPYQHVVDCATNVQGRFAFAARAVVRGSVVTSPSATVVVDRTPPVVESWNPAQYFPSLNDPLELVFSEPLRARSLQGTPTQIRDDSGLPVSHQAVLSEDGRVLRLLPATPLRAPVTLHIELSVKDLTDQAGNPFDAARYPAGFELSLSYWPFRQLGGLLSGRSIDEASLALERSPQDRPVFAFVERDGFPTKMALKVIRWTGERWVQLPPPRGDEDYREVANIASPRLEVDRRGGGLVLAWLEHDREDSIWWDLKVARYDGTSWVDLEFMNRLHSSSTYSPQFHMVLDESGSPCIVYEDAPGHFTVMQWNGTDLGWERLGPLHGDAYIGNLSTTTEAGAVVVAWSAVPPGETQQHVFVERFQDGSSQLMGRPLRGTAQSYTLGVAIKGGGRDGLTLAWLESDQDFRAPQIFVSRWQGSLSEGDWGPPEQLQDATVVYDLSRPWIDIDADGEPWVAWTRDESSVFRRRRAGGWEPEQLIGLGTLNGFRLGDRGTPWVSVGAPTAGAVLRPQ